MSICWHKQAAGKERPASPPGEPEEDVKEEVKEEEVKVADDPDPEKPGPITIEGLPETPCFLPRPRWDDSKNADGMYPSSNTDTSLETCDQLHIHTLVLDVEFKHLLAFTFTPSSISVIMQA